MSSSMKIIYSLCLLLMLLNGCKNDKDKFYTEIREYGLIRLPTVPPYFAGSTEGLKGPWFLNDSTYSGEEISSIDVVDSVIVTFYYNKWIRVPENRDTTWCIIIPNVEESYRFKNEKKFEIKLSTLTSKNPNFREVSDLWREFKEEGYLDWFPEEYKTK